MKIDSYLHHSFEVAERQQHEGGVESMLGPEVRSSGATAVATAVTLPMLLRVDRNFSAESIPDLRVTSQIGSIVAATGTIDSLDALETDPSVLSVEASRRGTLKETATSVLFVRGTVVQRPPIDERGSQALVAVIDGGLDPLHECFLDANGGTRIEAIWDQTDASGPTPEIALGFTGLAYGTVHTRADIDGYVASGTVPVELGRDSGDGHGTHVASIAAGCARGSFAGGMAPEARIVFVRPTLEVSTGDPWSLGYSNSHVDALRFVGHLADDLALPVVVNVSMGMNAGAHDGSSLLEAAFDDFTEGGRKAGRIIVKSAGNERGQDGHARITMASRGADEFRWKSHTPHFGPDNIELWFDPGDELRFRLRAPGTPATPWIDRQSPSLRGSFPSGIRYNVTLDRFFKDNGDARLLVTISGSGPKRIPAGDFVLEVESGTVASSGTVDAWIERDNTRPIAFTTNRNDEMTLSIPGTARTVVAVAAVGSKMPAMPGGFSSQGLTRDARHKPDVSAPGIDIEAAKAGTATGTIAMAGTSMASPHVAGAVALLLSACKRRGGTLPNAAQIGSALRTTAQNYNGRHNPRQGFGIINAEALLAAFS